MAADARKVNWFAIGISAAVVVVLVVIGGIVWFANSLSDSPGTVPESSIVDSETGAITIGDGANELDTYIDFMCPICNQFEQLYGETIQEQVDAGALTLNIHPISILDRYSQGTGYSTRSASAMYCVAVEAPDAAVPFMQAMFENQPAEQSTGLTDAEIVAIAEGVGADAAGTCITDGTYQRYVTSMTAETPVAPGAAGIGTPTVLLDGEFVSLTGDPQADIVDRLG